MKKIYLFSLLVLPFLQCRKLTRLDETISFTNPLLPTGPDPWVVQKDSFYYYMHTLGDRIEIWKTKNLSRLSKTPSTLIWRTTTTGLSLHNVWAPELHFIDGKWYIYYTAGLTVAPNNQRMFVLENAARDPTTGTWIDKGMIKDLCCQPVLD